MPDPTLRSVHYNRPLTNISVAFMQSESRFIARQVFPVVTVPKQSDIYYTYDRGYFNRDEMKVRAPGTASEGSGYQVDTADPYFCHVYAFHKDVDDQVRANADAPLNLDAEAARFVAMKGLLRTENDFFTNFFTTSVWDTDITGVAAAPGSSQALQWNDDSSDPIKDIQTGRQTIAESTGFEANTLVLGRHVYDRLTLHPDILDRIKYGQTPGRPAQVTRDALAALFEVDRILVGSAIQNTAMEGATNSHSFIAGRHALLCHTASSPGLMTPTAGYTFVWNGYAGMGDGGLRIKRFRMEELAADRIEGELSYDMRTISSELGYFFSGIVAS